MAEYKKSQLKGKGVFGNEINPGEVYRFSVTSSISGSSYFTLEAVRDNNGFYSPSSPNIKGSIGNEVNARGFVSSSYIFSLIIDEGGGEFEYVFYDKLEFGDYYLRGEGIEFLNFGEVDSTNDLLLENGGFLLLENGGKILLI